MFLGFKEPHSILFTRKVGVDEFDSIICPGFLIYSSRSELKPG